MQRSAESLSSRNDNFADANSDEPRERYRVNDFSNPLLDEMMVLQLQKGRDRGNRCRSRLRNTERTRDAARQRDADGWALPLPNILSHANATTPTMPRSRMQTRCRLSSARCVWCSKRTTSTDKTSPPSRSIQRAPA